MNRLLLYFLTIIIFIPKPSLTSLQERINDPRKIELAQEAIIAGKMFAQELYTDFNKNKVDTNVSTKTRETITIPKGINNEEFRLYIDILQDRLDNTDIEFSNKSNENELLIHFYDFFTLHLLESLESNENDFKNYSEIQTFLEWSLYKKLNNS
jgi:hypothetical protein